MSRVRGVVPLAVTLALALGAVGLLGFSTTLNPVDALLGRGAIVVVPDVAGRAQPSAVLAVERSGLSARVVDAFSLSEPRGTAIGQDPRPGTRLREGSVVEIVVSQGASRVEMPDAVGESIEAVMEPFDAAGIPVQLERTASEEVAADIVLDQSPGPGVLVTGADAVRFEVSDGPPERPVPDAIGKSLDAASFALGTAGLEVGEVTLTEDPDVPSGGVVATEPAPGSSVGKGDDIALTVSVGPAPVPMPDVTGRSSADASESLEQAGFVVRVAGLLLEDGARGVGRVADQYPEPGAQHRPGESVTIVVGRVADAPPTTAPPADDPDGGGG